MARFIGCAARVCPLAATVSDVQLIVHTHSAGIWTVLMVAGELDVVGGPELRQHVMATTREGKSNLVLDLTGVDFVDSFGLGVLVGSLKRARLANGDVRLVITEPRVRRVLELCDLDRVFVISDSVPGAIAASSDRPKP